MAYPDKHIKALHTHLASLCLIGGHNNDLHLTLYHHPPKVRHSMGQWSLMAKKLHITTLTHCVYNNLLSLTITTYHTVES